MDISSNGSDLGEGMSKLSDEKDQPCTLTGFFHFALYLKLKAFKKQIIIQTLPSD